MISIEDILIDEYVYTEIHVFIEEYDIYRGHIDRGICLYIINIFIEEYDIYRGHIDRGICLYIINIFIEDYVYRGVCSWNIGESKYAKP